MHAGCLSAWLCQLLCTQWMYGYYPSVGNYSVAKSAVAPPLKSATTAWRNLLLVHVYSSVQPCICWPDTIHSVIITVYNNKSRNMFRTLIVFFIFSFFSVSLSLWAMLSLFYRSVLPYFINISTHHFHSISLCHSKFLTQQRHVSPAALLLWFGASDGAVVCSSKRISQNAAVRAVDAAGSCSRAASNGVWSVVLRPLLLLLVVLLLLLFFFFSFSFLFDVSIPLGSFLAVFAAATNQIDIQDRIWMKRERLDSVAFSYNCTSSRYGTTLPGM